LFCIFSLNPEDDLHQLLYEHRRVTQEVKEHNIAGARDSSSTAAREEPASTT
jgi:hypothetical protein